MRGVAYLAGGSALGQGLTVLVAPILTRLYAPAEFGIAASYAAMLGIGLVVVTLGYQVAIPLPRDDHDATHLAALAFATTLLTGAALEGLILVGGPALAAALGLPGLAPYLWLLPISLVGAGLYQALYYWTLRRRNYAQLARTRLQQAVAQVGIQLGLGVAGLGAMGLVLGDVVGRMSGGGAMWRWTWREDASLWRGLTLAGLREVAVRYVRFPTMNMPTSLVNAVSLELPTLALAVLFGPVVAGLYALGQRAFGVPMELLGQAAGRVFYAEAAQTVQERPAALERLFWQTTAGLALAGGLPMLLAAIAAPWLFGLVFGPAWREAGVYLQILAPMYIMKIIASPPPVLVLLERQGLGLVREVARLVIMLGAIALASYGRLDPGEAIGLISLSGTVNYALYFAISWWALTRHREHKKFDGIDVPRPRAAG